MSDKRRDSKGRILRTGESQRKNGMYEFRYTDVNKKRRSIYDMDLMKLDVYAPEMEQALILKKNFLDNPKKAYKIMLALLTKDKETVGEALEELYGIV